MKSLDAGGQRCKETKVLDQRKYACKGPLDEGCPFLSERPEGIEPYLFTMKENLNPSLKEEAAKRILNGNLSEEDLREIINVAEDSRHVICSIDVYSDGSHEQHVTTEQEVFDYVCKNPYYDELMVALEDARNLYMQRVARAKHARASIGNKAS